MNWHRVVHKVVSQSNVSKEYRENCRSSLIRVCTVCSNLSVWKLRIITVTIFMKMHCLSNHFYEMHCLSNHFYENALFIKPFYKNALFIKPYLWNALFIKPFYKNALFIKPLPLHSYLTAPTIKIQKIWTSEKNAVFILKIEQCCFTTVKCSRDAIGTTNNVDPDRTAHCYSRVKR